MTAARVSEGLQEIKKRKMFALLIDLLINTCLYCGHKKQHSITLFSCKRLLRELLALNWISLMPYGALTLT